jgi:hypothetical protein
MSRTFRLLVVAVLTLLVLSPDAAHAAVLHLAQTTPDLSLASLVVAIVTPIIAALSTVGYDGLKTIIPPFDRAPAVVHQVAAPVFGFALGWLTTHLGVGLLTDIHQVGPEWIGAVLNAIFMAGLHRWQKARAPGDTTIKLAQSRTGIR